MCSARFHLIVAKIPDGGYPVLASGFGRATLFLDQCCQCYDMEGSLLRGVIQTGRSASINFPSNRVRIRLKSSLEPTLSLMRTGRLSGTFVWVCPLLDRLPQVHRPGTTDTIIAVRLRGAPQLHSHRAERTSILWRTALTYYICDSWMPTMPALYSLGVVHARVRSQHVNSFTGFLARGIEPPDRCSVCDEVAGVR